MPESRAESLHDIARAALGEITLPESVGADAGETEVEPGVVSVYFENTLAGYPGWRWTVSIATLEGEQPSVLETELTPTDGALLAPDWVPWSDRLAEYKASQEAMGEDAAADEDVDEDGDVDGDDDDLDTDDDDESDDDDDDESDDDESNEDAVRPVHGGDVDGVDIDDLDESATSD